MSITDTGDKGGNKGEWSEGYVFLKALCDGFIPDYRGDDYKHEIDHIRVFDKDGNVNLRIEPLAVTSGVGKISGIVYPWRKSTEKVLEDIKTGTNRAFTCPSLVEMCEILGVASTSFLKNPKNKKDDIVICFKEDGDDPLGYQIKSQVAASPSSMNVSPHTHLVFKVVSPLSTKELNEIARRGLKKFFAAVGYDNFQFVRVRSRSFSVNLGHDMSQMVGNLVKEYCDARGAKISMLVGRICQSKQKMAGFSENEWEITVQEFLHGSAYEWTPSKEKTIEDESSGGLIWVKDDGSLILRQWRRKRDLMNNIYRLAELDRGSSAKHDMGYVYEIGEYGSSAFPHCGGDKMTISVAELEAKSGIPLVGLAKSDVLRLTRHSHRHYDYTGKRYNSCHTWVCDQLRGFSKDRYINIGIGIRLGKDKKTTKGRV